MNARVLLIVTAALGSYKSQAQTNWTLDKRHTMIRFSVDHMMISEVNGTFNEFDGSVISSNEDFSDSKVTFSARTATVFTDLERRDNHLKSEDFFNAEEHPELKFSGNIIKEGGAYFLIGDFTVRGITREIKFDVKYNGTIPGRGGRKAGFKITGAIDRFDYGLKWDRTIETGSLVAGREVRITCNIELSEVTESN